MQSVKHDVSVRTTKDNSYEHDWKLIKSYKNLNSACTRAKKESLKSNITESEVWLFDENEDSIGQYYYKNGKLTSQTI